MRTNRVLQNAVALWMFLSSLTLSTHSAVAAVTKGTGVSLQQADEPVGSRKLKPIEMKSDFDQMRHALEEAHTGLYRYTPKVEMDRLFDAERAKLTVPLTKLGFLGVLSETLAGIRCGHTKVEGDEEVASAMKDAPKFPFQVLIDQQRVFVLFNDTANDRTMHPGMEITSINGDKVGDILARMYRYLPTDGDISSNKRSHAENHFAEYYWTLFPDRRNFLVDAKDADGKGVVSALAGVTDEERHKNQNPVNKGLGESLSHVMWTNDNLAFRFISDPNIAEIRIDHFVGDDFPTWMEATFKNMREKGTRTLILDLRGDGGGKDMYGALLLSYLSAKPFRYFDHIDIKTIDPSFKQEVDWSNSFAQKLRDGTMPNPGGGFLATSKLHEGLSEQLPAKYRFQGNVFVLTDGGTFSTAADFCAIAQHLKLAQFVGEETGGAYAGNNSGLVVELLLSHSKFKVTLPMYEYWNAVTPDQENRHGTIPDYAVTMSAADLLHGRDAQLDMAEKLAAR